MLNVISPLLLSSWCLSFAFGCGVSYFGGIQHSPVYGCSGLSCNFGTLAGDERRTYISCDQNMWISHQLEKDPVSPLVGLSHQEASISLLSFSTIGQTEWKPQSQKTNQIHYMDHSLVLTQWIYEPCHVGPHKTDGSWWTKHGPLEKGMATPSVFLLWEPHKWYENVKWEDTERWTPHVGSCPLCYWR